MAVAVAMHNKLQDIFAKAIILLLRYRMAEVTYGYWTSYLLSGHHSRHSRKRYVDAVERVIKR